MKNLIKKIIDIFDLGDWFNPKPQEMIDESLRLNELNEQASDWQVIDQEQLKSSGTNEKK